MASSWLNALENLQSQFVGLPEVEKHFEKDFQWVEEIFAEATTLFKKDTTQEVSENTNEDDTPNGLEVAPVLLPQTPRVKKDRAERLGNSRSNISRRSSIRVVTGALAGKKTSRQASKAASQKISKAVDAMTNLGKKMRRPTLANGTVTFVSNESTEEIIGESEKNNESYESCNELQLEDEPEDEQEAENKEKVVDETPEEVKETNVEIVEEKPTSNEDESGNRRQTRTKAQIEVEVIPSTPEPSEEPIAKKAKVQDETQTSENLEEVKETNVEMVEDKPSPDEDVSGSQLEEAQEAENEQKRLENERELQEAEEKRKIEEKEKKNLEAKRKCEEEEVNKPSMTDVKDNRRLTRAERATKKAKIEDETHVQPQPSEEKTAEEIKETNVEMAEAKPRHNDDDSGNRRLTRTKAKVEATESRRLTRAKNQKDKVENETHFQPQPSEPEVKETNVEMVEDKSSQALQASQVFSPIFSPEDKSQKVEEEAKPSTPNETDNRRLTRTKAKVEEEAKPSTPEETDNRRRTRTKAKLEEEAKPSTPESTENRRLTRAKKAKGEDDAHLQPQPSQRMTRTKAKTNLKDGVEINSDNEQQDSKSLAKSVSASTLRSQTTANLRALAAASKAPSTSALIAAAKKGPMNLSSVGSVYGRGGLHSPKPGTSSTSKGGSSSNMGSRFKSRILDPSPCRGGPSNLLDLKSFLPGKPVVHKPTSEEIQHKKEEELRLRKEKEEEAQRRREELQKAKLEEKRQQREARAQRVKEARQAQEEKKLLAKQNQEKENREKLEALNRLKEARAAENEQKRLENERKLQEVEEKRKIDEQEKKRKDDENKKNLEAKRKREEEEAKIREEKRRQEEEALKKRKAEIEAEEKHRREEEARLKEERFAKLRDMVMKKNDGNATFNQSSAALNRTYDKNDTSQLNSTYTKPGDQSTVASYDITPARHELPPEPLKDEENYDIGDLKSDDDTDDDEAPRKIIPKWASGSAFRAALMHQAYNPPDIDSIFFVQEATPELSEIFEQKKRRYFKRTSSAVWGKAPVTHKW